VRHDSNHSGDHHQEDDPEINHDERPYLDAESK
jgi:hypothetical protein